MAIKYHNPRRYDVVTNWPSGGKRVDARFTVEAMDGKGERATRITVDPTTGRESQPKKLTYAKRVRIVSGDDGQTYILCESETHISVMRGDMRFSEETIFPDNPRFAETIALFDEG